MNGNRTSILVAIIAFIGTVIPILVTSLSNWISNTPAVNIDFVPYSISYKDNNTDGVEITLTNSGFGSATNLMAIVEAPGKIGNYVNEFSTVEISSIEIINNTRLDIHIPRLVQGSGSVVKLNLSLSQDRNTLSDSYNAYVTYDQGSNAKRFTWADSLEDKFANFWNGFGQYIGLTAFFFLIPDWSLAICIFLPNSPTKKESRKNDVHFMCN